MPIHRTLNKNFFKTWSPEMAYVLGYFAADGSMIKNKRGAHFIEFTTTDKILLNHLQRVTASNHAISKRPVRNKKWKQQYRLQIGSKQWFLDLTALGFIQNKSNTLCFPMIPDHFFCDFVRGYFDGDGGVYFKKVFSKERNKDIWVFSSHFTSGSPPFLRELHHRLKRRGVNGGTLVSKKTGYALQFSRYDSLALYEIMYNNTKATVLYLPRKKKVFERAKTVLYEN